MNKHRVSQANFVLQCCRPRRPNGCAFRGLSDDLHSRIRRPKFYLSIDAFEKIQCSLPRGGCVEQFYQALGNGLWMLAPSSALFTSGTGQTDGRGIAQTCRNAVGLQGSTRCHELVRPTPPGTEFFIFQGWAWLPRQQKRVKGGAHPIRCIVSLCSHF